MSNDDWHNEMRLREQYKKLGRRRWLKYVDEKMTASRKNKEPIPIKTYMLRDWVASGVEL